MSQPRSVNRKERGRIAWSIYHIILSEKMIRNDHKIEDTYVQSRDVVPRVSVNYNYINVKLSYTREKEGKRMMERKKGSRIKR